MGHLATTAGRYAARFPHLSLVDAVLIELSVLSVGAYAYFLAQAPAHFQDFAAYLAAGRDLRAHQSLYSAFLLHPFPDPLLRPAFIYPPPFALLPATIAGLPQAAAALLWLGAIEAALLTAVLLGYRALGRPSRSEALVAVVLTANFYPLLVDLWQGQANTFLMAAAAVFLWALTATRDRMMGAAAAAAAAIKILPGLWLVLPLLARRGGALAWGGLAGAGILLAGILAAGWNQTVTYFTRVLPALGQGTAAPANESIWGVLRRLFGPDPYAHPPFPWQGGVPWLALFVSGALTIWWLRARPAAPGLGSASADFAALICLLLLVAGVSWEHHFALLVLPMWVALRTLRQSGLRRADLLAFGAFYAGVSLVPRLRATIPAETPFGWPVANSVFVGTTILFFWLCSTLRRPALSA